MIVLDDQLLAVSRCSNDHDIPVPGKNISTARRLSPSGTHRIVPLSIFWANGNKT